jgi:hypothetical protein
MLTSSPQPHVDRPRSSSRSRWVFVGKQALPTDPAARELEKRGRRWLIVSYVLCPCHLPITLSLFAVVFGGTSIGAVATGHAGWVAIALTSLYGLVLWQGFRRIRAAKALAARGLEIDCATGSCAVSPTPPGR